jgi:hypothetical protein
MFDQLFVRSDALTRYLPAPLVDERRRQYLTHCAAQGMTGNLRGLFSPSADPPLPTR